MALKSTVVEQAYEEAYARDWKRAENISDNPGVPMYPTRFSMARCKRFATADFDCTFRVKMPMDGGWQKVRATFSRAGAGIWLLTNLKYSNAGS